MRDYGTNVVGGVTPGKGGPCTRASRLDTVADAIKHTGANATVIYRPAARRADANPRGRRRGHLRRRCITEGIRRSIM